MANKRDLKLDKFNISKYRYRELSNFCLQYPEFLAERQQYYVLSGVSYDGLSIDPKGKKISDSTARNAERALKLSEKINLIEKTAFEACGELAPYILKAVTSGLNWDKTNYPCGRRQFYLARRKFFFLLDCKIG